MTLGIPLGEMLERMPSDEFSDYWAYYTLAPWGEDRADTRMGIQTSSLINVQLDKKSKPLKPDDFIVDYLAAARRRSQAADPIGLEVLNTIARFEALDRKAPGQLLIDKRPKNEEDPLAPQS